MSGFAVLQPDPLHCILATLPTYRTLASRETEGVRVRVEIGPKEAEGGTAIVAREWRVPISCRDL